MTLDYSGYLCLDALLSLQRPQAPAEVSDPGSDPGSDAVRSAEHLFIVVHQASELWMAQLLLDLDLAASALRRGSADTAAEHVERAAALFGVLRAQLDVLDRLPPACFARFRPYLGTASGAQSRQFAALERALGFGPTEPPLATALAEAAAAAGVTLPEVWRSGGPLRRVADAMSAVARGYRDWQAGHLAVVRRMLGDLPGTGGTAGARYLASRVRLAFPGLHAARHEAGETVPTA
ncbi:tryptophan 2,3-dioxygenase family protein [Actinosynnema sp. NPDC091369]